MSHQTKSVTSPISWSAETSVYGPLLVRDFMNHTNAKFTSDSTELWTDEQQQQTPLRQKQQPKVTKKLEHLSRSVPPSPTFVSNSKQKIPSYNVYNFLNRKCIQKYGAFKARFVSSKQATSSKTCSHRQGDHSDLENKCSRVALDSSSESGSNVSCANSCMDINLKSPHSIGSQPCDQSETSNCSCYSLGVNQEINENSSLGVHHMSDTVNEETREYLDDEMGNRLNTTDKTRQAIVHSFDNRLYNSTEVCSRPSTVTTSKTRKIILDDYSSAGWPTPVPIQSSAVCPFASSTLDTVNVFKYRINYPSLSKWVHDCMLCYIKWCSGDISSATIRSLMFAENLDCFMQEILKKQNHKLLSFTMSNQGKIKVEQSSGLPTHSNYALHNNQLWKRRYYSLLNAVDFVFKDHQILHYVSREGLFECVSNPPAVPAILFSKGREFSQRSRGGLLSSRFDSHSLAAIGADPAGHLSERVTQLLIRMGIHQLNRNDLQDHWPCMFNMSVAFLSDVIAQSRILRTDLDRRLAVHDRLVYVLGQAREQRSKLRLHMLKQRELLNSLTSKLNVIRQRASITSPVQDQPSSIDDGLAKNVISPFVECENLESEATDHVSVSTEFVSHETADMSALDLGKQEWGNAEYLHKRAELQIQIASLERVLKEEETRRKRLHNRIQELTGNIRVFCRLRPNDADLLEQNKTVGSNKSYLRVSSDDKLLFCSDTLKELLPGQGRAALGTLNVSTRGLLNSGTSTNQVQANSTGTPKCFIFDRVFGTDASQLEVYREVDDLIVSCIDGYNVCIMAYGQTGSGKTYTMMGTPENPGVNRRAVRSLFERCGRRKHWKYSISVSMVEIYQEDVFDLLEDVTFKTTNDIAVDSRQNSPTTIQSTNSDRKRVSISRSSTLTNKLKQPTPWNSCAGRANFSGYSGFTPRKALRRRGSVKIMSDNLDGVVLRNLNESLVQSEEEMLAFLELAEKQRRVGLTRLNICSSRSHLIILLKVVGQNQLHMTTSRGSLTLADLAGSENVTKSGSTGERFMEAASINKSLSSLGRVFDALRRQQKPTYRETKLTYLLRPNLGGESKCLLFVAIRTEPEHAEETWRAVNFGQGALQVIPGSQDVGKSRSSCNLPTNESSCTQMDRQRGSAPPLFRCAVRKHKLSKQRENQFAPETQTHLPQAVYSMGPAITKRGWQ
ncbi:Kinesin motor domain protein [Paragonimus heterotremus]|uniref:Kinesin motor domain protein n=1 Tax=Paragonimus heterotremus TaxID=100268 RepID=A0A8J4TB38_9TREM|nr:Kinesin motor domain protein [Paragonimus heterotremus]